MLEFKPVTKRDGGKLRKYYQDCKYGLCEYSVGAKLMWRKALGTQWTEAEGCLIVRNYHYGRYMFDYPVPGPEGDEDAALAAIEADCLERGVPMALSVVPEEKVCRLVLRYPYVEVSSLRTWKDYI